MHSPHRIVYGLTTKPLEILDIMQNTKTFSALGDIGVFRFLIYKSALKIFLESLLQ